MNSDAQSGIRVLSLASLALRSRWRVEAMRTSSDHLLIWFTRGQGRITVGGVTRGYGAHNAIFVPAGVMHGFELGRQVLGSALYLPADLPDPLPGQAMHIRAAGGKAQGQLTGYIDTIRTELEDDEAAANRAARHYAGLVSVWLDRQPQTPFVEDTHGDASVRLAARYAEMVERDFRSGRQVADYADALGVTPTHLSRACKAASGRNASSLLSERLTSEARRLLKDSRDPIGAIARDLGFSSAAYFSRAFQAQTGQTPSAFRRNG